MSLTPQTYATGNAVVACADVHASKTALDILKKGGNAFDAMVACMATLSVTRPYYTGPGGGGFATLYEAKTRKTYFINGRERAPRSARSNMFQDSKGIQLPFYVAFSTGSSMGVPGTFAMMNQISENFGKIKTWDVLFDDAIHLAKNGFEVDQSFYSNTWNSLWKLRNWTYSSSLFLPNRDSSNLPIPLNIGETFKNPDYSKTLEGFVKHGIKYLYNGKLGCDFVNAVQNLPNYTSPIFSFYNPQETPVYGNYFDNPPPSLITAQGYAVSGANMTVDDLQAYTAPICEPLEFNYRGYTIVSSPPPSSGGLSIAAMLKTLEPFTLKGDTPNNAADAYSLFLNAQGAAFADRGKYMADAEFVNVPIVGLLCPTYLQQRSDLLWPNRSNPPTNVLPVSAGNPFQFQPTSVSGKGFDFPSTQYEENQLSIVSKSNGGTCESKDPCAPINKKTIFDLGSTTHTVIIDSDGNIASVTHTLEQNFAGGFTLPGYGFLINNELTDFNFGGYSANWDSNTNIVTPGSYRPGGANEAAAFKRPRSSMAPTIVLDCKRRGKYALGASGGSYILVNVAQQLMQLIDFKWDIKRSNDAFRLNNHNYGDFTDQNAGKDIVFESAIISILNSRNYGVVTPPTTYQNFSIANLGNTISQVAEVVNPKDRKGLKNAAAQDVYQLGPEIAAIPPYPFYTPYSCSALASNCKKCKSCKAGKKSKKNKKCESESE